MKDIKKLKKDDFVDSFGENYKKWKLKDLKEHFKFTHINTKSGKKLKAIEGVNCLDCFAEMKNDEHSNINKNYCISCY